MNEGMAGTKMKEEPKLMTILGYQDEIDMNFNQKIKDLHEVCQRLDGLANRINSTNFPKNQPMDGSISRSPEQSESPKDLIPDGLVGALNRANQMGSKRISEIQSVITSIFITINYLEDHI